MIFPSPPPSSPLAVSAFAVASMLLAAPPPTRAQPLESITDFILDDLMKQYSTYKPSECSSSSSITTHGFDFPGTNTQSEWASGFADYEEGMFQAWMKHTDEGGDRSWTLRFGTGGNIYSLFVPDRHGETMPPQEKAPRAFDVHQSISVNEKLNETKPYAIHQAGVHMDDPDYMDKPYHSPSLGARCFRDSCTFVSWGQSAHVPTPFTSPVMNINRYTNCGDGVIEHTQMLHNFADPSDPLSTADNVDQTYFNVPWSVVRKSAFPFALEPDPASGALAYDDVLHMCPWGSDAPGDNPGAGSDWRGQREDLKNLGGYTTFVGKGLKIDKTRVQSPCGNQADTKGATDLEVEARPTGKVDSDSDTHDPASLSAFTYIYGDEDRHVGGGARRRIGTGLGQSDYNVFTINWHGPQARLGAGSTYSSRAFYAVGDLGSARATADKWRRRTVASKIEPIDWEPRGIKMYFFEHSNKERFPPAFAIRIATSPGESHVRGCGSGGTIYTDYCTGWSTPKPGFVPYFRAMCGSSSYIGPDPYYHSPDFGGSFPGHGDGARPVRSYVCDGQPGVRPEMKLLGFFDPEECPAKTGLAHDRYACTICRNNRQWRTQKKRQTHGCSWIGKAAEWRCPRWRGKGTDTRLAIEACGKTCNPYCRIHDE